MSVDPLADSHALSAMQRCLSAQGPGVDIKQIICGLPEPLSFASLDRAGRRVAERHGAPVQPERQEVFLGWQHVWYSRLQPGPHAQARDRGSITTPDLFREHPMAALTLARGEIHVWRAKIDQPVADLDPFSAMLSEDESARVARYRFEKDRTRFILRRSLLRVILSCYLDTEPAQLRFAYGPCGKPAIAQPRDDNLQFNLSHSDGMALYAVTRDEAIGVDVERVRVIQEADQIGARYFSPEEMVTWRSLPRDQQPEAFLRLWSRKEASLKLSGRGLFDVVEWIPSRQGTAAWDEASVLPRCFAPNTANVLYELTPAPEYVGALALAVPEVARA